MKKLVSAIRPQRGFSEASLVLLVLMLPLAVFLLVMIDLAWVALALLLLSKWRVFTVRMRYWPSLLRANAVDLTVGLSTLAFMTATDSDWVRLGLAALYAIWLLLLKPYSDIPRVTLQAITAQFLGLLALFSVWGDASTAVLVIGAWVVCYVSAYHFFLNMEEPRTALYARTWGYFAAVLTWILSHWLLFYGILAQPVLILSVVGYGIAGAYFMGRTDKLDNLSRQQIVLTIIAVLTVIIVFSSWDHPNL